MRRTRRLAWAAAPWPQATRRGADRLLRQPLKIFRRIGAAEAAEVAAEVSALAGRRIRALPALIPNRSR
jgi:hypothetical protein